jgi:polyhydroxybutyrate depolymerase
MGYSVNTHIQVPNDATNKPLVLLLHGHGGSHKQSIGADGTKAPQKVWLTLADENEFILVIPNGLLGPEDSRGWNDCRDDAVGNPESDDIKFLSVLLDEVEEEYDYDVNRTYVTGISNGAMMTLRLAHEIPNKITAFGAIVNSMAANSKCNDSDIAISALFMNGTEDPLVPYDGGQIASNRGEVISTDESINYWIARNNTQTEATEEILEDKDPDDESTITKFVYENGTNDTEVVLYRVDGGGHTEPSLVEKFGAIYLAIVGVQNHDLEMAEEVWEFFRDKSK